MISGPNIATPVQALKKHHRSSSLSSIEKINLTESKFGLIEPLNQEDKHPIRPHSRSVSIDSRQNKSRRPQSSLTSPKRRALSKKTLYIVNNLQSYIEPTASDLHSEEMAESSSQISRKQSERFDYYIKLLLLGDSGVGKSSLMYRFSEDYFAPNLMPTAGVDFKVRFLEIDGKRVKVQVWDTAGQERFHTITKAYYRGAHGIVLLYDVTDEETFSNIEYWMDSIQQNASSNVETILLGNKIDRSEERIIERSRGEAMARDKNVRFFETSAKTGEQVDESFLAITRQIMSRDLGIAEDMSPKKLPLGDPPERRRLFPCIIL